MSEAVFPRRLSSKSVMAVRLLLFLARLMLLQITTQTERKLLDGHFCGSLDAELRAESLAVSSFELRARHVIHLCSVPVSKAAQKRQKTAQRTRQPQSFSLLWICITPKTDAYLHAVNLQPAVHGPAPFSTTRTTLCTYKSVLVQQHIYIWNISPAIFYTRSWCKAFLVLLISFADEELGGDCSFTALSRCTVMRFCHHAQG